jgi:hypothetical protein
MVGRKSRGRSDPERVAQCGIADLTIRIFLTVALPDAAVFYCSVTTAVKRGEGRGHVKNI